MISLIKLLVRTVGWLVKMMLTVEKRVDVFGVAIYCLGKVKRREEGMQ
jgi:hypothetical protein